MPVDTSSVYNVLFFIPYSLTDFTSKDGNTSVVCSVDTSTGVTTCVHALPDGTNSYSSVIKLVHVVGTSNRID